ncbi:helicase [Paraflavitalea soli]|uniref:Helicase n=1 Tax=Paraflavitalea soli TaxID=2315862 RepID=A0A3B7MSC0_9BACT|nr:helix-turn-helix domain-containing protein [Paraflavitalea soli]AXY76747.1 helicase [Paraflavitalea soli]
MSSGTDISNEYFQLAVRFVNQTSRHLFLTGKAGTGKTTFLRYIQQNSFKKMAVVAPTGVAAINAGGVTMHSFFQLPFGPFIPIKQGGWQSGGPEVTDQHSLFKNIRFNNAKRELLRELELLVIDEVSMVRADMLDAIDAILRQFRRQPLLPFGGVQVLYIGDLHQLPPVVGNDEWDNILKHHYASPFFFDAQVIKQAPPVYLELKKIYRQNDASFIQILNNLRNNTTSAEDLRQLHNHYYPGFTPEDDEHYITLTSHNYKADKINQYQLAKLPGEIFEFRGEIKGDFNEKALPAEMTLQLKEGAQIMFIKNDKGELRRYFNGKLGIVKAIEKDKIMVSFPNEEIELELEQETWKNIRYSYNKEKDHIDEEELGTFKQYPIRLAWAITIHKSQGLTFQKAIIDAGESFAPGQVYVALSRLTSMEGLVLYSRIQPHCISTDQRVIAFTSAEMETNELQQALQEERKAFVSRSIVQSFDWTKVTAAWDAHFEGYEERQIPDKNRAVIRARAMLAQIMDQQEVAVKFMRQLEQLVITAEADGYGILQQRLQAATSYFILQLEEVSTKLQQHIDEVKVKQKVKKYVKELQELKLLFQRKKQSVEQAMQIVNALVKGVQGDDLLQMVENQKKAAVIVIQEVEEKVIKPKKGETKIISLQLFKEGKNIAAIAALRGMAVSTIEGHLVQFIATGEINIEDIVPEHKIVPILEALEAAGGTSSSAAKEKLGEDYSYSEIRAVMQYRYWLQRESV